MRSRRVFVCPGVARASARRPRIRSRIRASAAETELPPAAVERQGEHLAAVLTGGAHEQRLAMLHLFVSCARKSAQSIQELSGLKRRAPRALA